MNAELINTGSELLLGRVLNTHQQWLGRQLSDLGWSVSRQVSVPDAGDAIRDAVAEALRRSDLVIVTGGLGPTSDDLTRERIADLFGTRLVPHQPSLENIRSYFAARGRPMPNRVEIQAQIPEGAMVLANAFGTAPGLAFAVEPGLFRKEPSWLVLLPGPPRELHPMFEAQVVPLLQEHFPPADASAVLTLHTCGLGESSVEDRLSPILPPFLARGLVVGYCARIGEVDVRLVVRGPGADSLISEAEREVRRALGDMIFGQGDDLLEEVVIRAAADRKVRIAVAESCTGGFLANRLTNVPGASSAFWGGWITYDNAAKERELGVQPATLRDHGAVSEACVREMAEGALRRSGVEHAVAITGIAGPTGGTPDKPVGTVFIGIASVGLPTFARRFLNPFERETFKFASSEQALDRLRRRLLNLPVEPPM